MNILEELLIKGQTIEHTMFLECTQKHPTLSGYRIGCSEKQQVNFIGMKSGKNYKILLVPIPSGIMIVPEDSQVEKQFRFLTGKTGDLKIVWKNPKSCIFTLGFPREAIEKYDEDQLDRSLLVEITTL